MTAICYAPVASPLPVTSVATSVANPGRRHLTLPHHNRVIRLFFSDIVRLEGAGNYTIIHTRDNRQYLSSKTLKSLERAFTDPAFCRVHKSALINLAYVKQVNFGTGPYLRLSGEQFISISRRRLASTRRHIQVYQRLTGTNQQLAA